MTTETVAMEVRNHLAALRQKRGLSAAHLAAAVGVSRQSIYAMEAGSYVPNTAIALKLAHILGVRVEDIFLLHETSTTPPSVEAELLPLPPDGRKVLRGQPLHLCDVHGRLVAVPSESDSWSLPAADAVAVTDASSDDRVQAEILGEDKGIEKRLLLAGCDPSAPVLGRYLQKHGVDLVVVYQNSSQSVELLKQGVIHLAGTHIAEGDKGASELAAMRKSFGRQPIEIIRYALWEEGIVVREGNPKNIQSIEDLTRKNVKIVNREAGAGCRLLLDSQLKRFGISHKSIRGYDQVELGHLPAARRVQEGEADCCISTRATARVLGLDFVPLVSKWYDLVLFKPTLELPSVQLLIQVLSQSAFRRELEGLWGYDMRSAGALLS